MCRFVPNFVSCFSANYYLNWLTVWKVSAKIERVNFLLRHSVHYYLNWLTIKVYMDAWQPLSTVV